MGRSQQAALERASQRRARQRLKRGGACDVQHDDAVDVGDICSQQEFGNQRDSGRRRCQWHSSKIVSSNAPRVVTIALSPLVHALSHDAKVPMQIPIDGDVNAYSVQSESLDGDTSAPQLQTTVMLRNLPRNYTREMLIGLFDNQGFAGRYDFVFLPIDFSSGDNQGCAYVNLLDNITAAQFWDAFHGFSHWWRAWCKEICEVSWSSMQGLDAHVAFYRDSPLMHELVPDEYKPAMFCKGVRVPFPTPSTRVWCPQNQAGNEEPMRISYGDVAPCLPSIPPTPPSECPELRTTVMLKNLPSNYTRRMLLGLFDNQEFAGLYDFILLPLDFKTCENRGYAHVNLVSHLVAAQFWDTFHGFSNWWRAWGKEVCEVTWSPLQGLDAHIARYRDSPLMHQLVPDEFKPAIFSEGVRCPFPAPTQKIRPPRIRRHGLTEFPAARDDGDHYPDADKPGDTC